MLGGVIRSRKRCAKPASNGGFLKGDKESKEKDQDYWRDMLYRISYRC
jgi:hypothetical protein